MTKTEKEAINLYPIWEGPGDSLSYGSKLNKKRRYDLEEVVFGPLPPLLLVREELKH